MNKQSTVTLLLTVLLAGWVFAEDYYWSGNSADVTSSSSWTGGTPQLYNSQAENDVWDFDVDGTDPKINQPNIRLGGMKFGENSGSYTFAGSNPLNFYGFNENGTYYMLRNTSGQDQVFNSGEINIHNNLTIDTNAQIYFLKHVNFRDSQQTITVTGKGGVTFSSNVNINSTKFHFANSGDNNILIHFNSLKDLHLSGGGTTTFQQSVSVNNGIATIEGCFTTGIFQDTFNADKLLVMDGGTAVFTGNNQKNFNQGIELRGGTLLMERNNIVGENKLLLSGGNLDLNNTRQQLESLTLTANSSIDFGDNLGFNQLKFNDVTPAWDSDAVLTILGFQDGKDEFEIKTISDQQLSQILFYGDYGNEGVGYYTATKSLASSGDFYYVSVGSFSHYGSPDSANLIPNCCGLSPVPEPTTVGFGSLLGLAAIFHLWQRNRRKKQDAA